MPANFVDNFSQLKAISSAMKAFAILVSIFAVSSSYAFGIEGSRKTISTHIRDLGDPAAGPYCAVAVEETVSDAKAPTGKWLKYRKSSCVGFGGVELFFEEDQRAFFQTTPPSRNGAYHENVLIRLGNQTFDLELRKLPKYWETAVNEYYPENKYSGDGYIERTFQWRIVSGQGQARPIAVAFDVTHSLLGTSGMGHLTSVIAKVSDQKTCVVETMDVDAMKKASRLKHAEELKNEQSNNKFSAIFYKEWQKTIQEALDRAADAKCLY